jgi:hypothetical protein
MGILLNLTKEYFEDIEREEDKIGLEGVKRVSFTDGNGKFHKNGYQPENRGVLDKLMQVLIGRRGNEGDFNDVDTSLITSMSFLFMDSKFNGNISGWDVSKVKTMDNMFNGATAFNQPIGNWKFPIVTDMGGMFNSATAFNQDIGKWEFPEVTDMNGMFTGATDFNQDIGKWKFPKIEFMNYMFNGATTFDQDISEWDIGSVISAIHMFDNCPIKDENKPKVIR